MVNNTKYTFPKNFESNQESTRQTTRVTKRHKSERQQLKEDNEYYYLRFKKNEAKKLNVIVPPLNQLINKNSKRLNYIITNSNSVQSCRNRDLPNFSQQEVSKAVPARSSSRTKMDSLGRLNPFQTYKEQKKAEMFPI